MRHRRISTRVHDRKIDRNVARTAFKKQGVHRPNKMVSEHWREYSK